MSNKPTNDELARGCRMWLLAIELAAEGYIDASLPVIRDNAYIFGANSGSERIDATESWFDWEKVLSDLGKTD